MSSPPSAPLSTRPQPSGKDDCNWAMLAHLSALTVLVFPLGHVLAPFGIWYFYRNTSPFVADQARESLNAQISYSLYLLGAAVLMLVVIGFIIFPLILLADLILIAVAAYKAQQGIAFRYPLIIRFVQ